MDTGVGTVIGAGNFTNGDVGTGREDRPDVAPVSRGQVCARGGVEVDRVGLYGFGRTIEAPGTFDAGWLRLGFGGHQLWVVESYNSTDRLQLCSVGLPPLGLPNDDRFWSDAHVSWA